MSHSSVAGPKSSIRSYRSLSAWLVLLAICCLGVGADLWSKHWAFSWVASEPVVIDREQVLADPNYQPIPRHEGYHALPGSLLDLRLVINHGAVFGIGEHQRWFFIAFTMAALVAGLFVFGRFTTARQHLAHVALGFILAGGMGNLYDRIVFAVVRDFLHLFPGRMLPFGWKWPGPSNNPELFPWVFNLADMMLLTGMILLMWHINRVEKRRKREEQKNTSEESPATT